MQNSTILIAIKVTSNGIQTITKKNDNYWHGSINESTCEIDSTMLTDKSAIKVLLSKGYELTSTGRLIFNN